MSETLLNAKCEIEWKMCTLVHFKASFFLASCPNETNSKTRTLLKPDLKPFSTRKFQHEDTCKRGISPGNRYRRRNLFIHLFKPLFYARLFYIVISSIS